MIQNHSERSHALLSASQAERWLNCPPSARLQEGIPDKPSEYAAEGTAAHELAEASIKLSVVPNLPEEEFEAAERQRKRIKAGKYYNAEMEQAISSYVDYVCDQYFQARNRSQDTVIMVEQKLDFSEWVPEGFGTGDVVIISDGVLEIIDLKYGKGVPVKAEGNPQMRLYALGAWAAYNWLYDIQEVQMTIVQPRLDSINTASMTIEELLEWGEKVKPIAQLAWEGKGEFKAGSHCRWCKVKATCRARAEEIMKALQYEFQDPALLSDEEIGSILFIADQLRAWAKDVEEYAMERALQGARIPQWKLVEGKSNRMVTDPEALIDRLVKAGYKKEQITETKLVGLSKLEKIVPKRRLAELAGELIVKPPGKPVLVPETDSRPELNSLEHDFQNIDFKEDDLNV